MRARGRWIFYRDADGGIDVHAQVFLLPLEILVHRARGEVYDREGFNAWRAGGAPECYATHLERVEGKEYSNSILNSCMLYGIPRKSVALHCFAVVRCAARHSAWVVDYSNPAESWFWREAEVD